MTKVFLTNDDVQTLALQLHHYIIAHPNFGGMDTLKICPIPRGGVPAAYALANQAPDWYRVVDNPVNCDILVDDIVDSGATARKYYHETQKPTVALVDRRIPDSLTGWIVFPWEHREGQDDSVTDNIVRLLQYIGEDPGRGGLQETPHRVAKAWKEWTSGYGKDAGSVLKVFEDGADNYDQMVVVKDIPIYSKCEHHLADIFGTATIAYIPQGKIVGLSKLSRLAEVYARRLQVQERLTGQIADALDLHLNPVGVGVMIRARHMCMESRGLCQQGHHTITTALRGVLLTDPAARAEFMSLA